MKLNKDALSLLSLLTVFLTTTAQATMGTACLFLVNQPKVPNCLLREDK